MLTGRKVLAAAIVMVIVSIGASILSSIQPLDRGGRGANSYGNRAHGYKGIFDVLAELGVRTERSLLPFDSKAHGRDTFVVWGPDEDLVDVEPVYIHRLRSWIEQGGRAVVATSGETGGRNLLRRAMARQGLDADTNTLEALGLKKLSTRTMHLDTVPQASDPEAQLESTQDDEESDSFSDAWQKSMSALPREVRQLEVRGRGEFAALAKRVKRLSVPEELHVLELDDAKPVGKITAKIGAADEVLAAKFRMGKGEVIIVSEPGLLANHIVARSDNPVLAFDLMAAGGRRVAWDEFYHGLTVRGNPWFLLSRGRYALLALFAVATVGLWAWRQAIFIGPPLAPPATSRRSIAEYVESMARFFRRGRHSSRFAIETMRDGVLWWTTRRVRVGRGQDTPEQLAAALARRDPAAAGRLLDAVAAANLTLSSRRQLSDAETLQVIRKLAACL